MIASVHGRVAALGPDGAVVEVGGSSGIGLAVSCSPATLARLRVGDTARLSTSLVVREDSLTLYGFSDDDERGLFELLQTANGVGPKLAQTILGVYPPREVRRAIVTGDYPALVKVPGIGRKGAEKIVIELRDRIGAIDGDGPGAPLAGVTAIAPWKDQVLHALASLGFGGKEAAEAVDAVVADSQQAGADNPEVAIILRRAIQLLGRTR
jgi:Holliday junction DNA helicase RuvA